MADKRYCVEVMDGIGFAFTEQEYNDHPNIIMDNEEFKVCYGKNYSLILVPLSSWDVYSDEKGYYSKEE